MVKLCKDNAVADLEVWQAFRLHSRKILAGKKLVTLQALSERIGHLDKHIVRDAILGFRLTGFQKCSGYISEQVVVPLITEVQLAEVSIINNVSMMNKTRSSGDEAVDLQLWELAMEEAAAGWLSWFGLSF